MADYSGRDEHFINWLENRVLSEDRTTLAHLRRGVGKPPGSALEMYPYLVKFLSPEEVWWIERCYFMVASLFAMYSVIEKGENMGKSMAKVMKATKSGNIEQRFTALLTSHREDLHNHLRHNISLAASKNIGIDWLLLLKNIKHWNHPHQFVQRAWAYSFWKENDERERGEKENED